MCTAIGFQAGDHYFGRNLDLSYSYHETVTVMPRRYPLRFRRMGDLNAHLAMIGMAYVQDGVPLYYDATNEKGLSMAGLNFPQSAVYQSEAAGRDNVTPFELIPWILGQCATVAQARPLLARLNLLDEPFSDALPLSPLHWLVEDQQEALVLEPMADGLHIHEAPVRVLTNEPPFPAQMDHLRTYLHLTPCEPENHIAPALSLTPYGHGLGAVGLPGDLSSTSRFVRAAFTLHNSVCEPQEASAVSQFFHVLQSVSSTRGTVRLHGGQNDITVYSSCVNADRGLYYYTTYDNSRVTLVDMHREDLDGRALRSYPLITQADILRQN